MVEYDIHKYRDILSEQDTVVKEAPDPEEGQDVVSPDESLVE